MYKVHITARPQDLGADPTYDVAVFPPGQSSANTATINEHNLEVILNEILPSPAAARECLRKAGDREGALIEILTLSEQHSKMLRGQESEANKW